MIGTPAPDEVLDHPPAGRSGRRSTDEEFTAFVRDNHRRLLRVAELLTGDRGRAEDLLQTVLVRAYQRWGRIAQDNPVGYVRAGLVNAHTDWWRRRSSWERPIAAPEVRSTVVDPAGGVTGRQAMLAALAPLTRRERTVVVLRFYEDLTVPEIARTLRIPPGTVKSTCARALAKLRLSPDLADLPDDPRTEVRT
jgi:RNA polymerase sigma-70 factor (sigma-E family)